ncbi:ankyrin repeat-containing domain protein [Radiomyces spectabilis]|uniref:ankyrin repeat-containing domain protein n=1 Tax=Radiomyces spectabilis TaxID=64574 RepID=UPI00221F3A0B|nr:ankyrin repeat-containing domain protein [Radiomyces spectabilis]KAI8366737.1 ankyrin repeat-containing domain protein [Radiomyces spectabilis]
MSLQKLVLKHLHSPDQLRNVLTTFRDGELQTSIDLKDDHGDALVHFAARSQSLPAIQLLHEFGADMEAVNEHGRTPIHESIDSYEITAYLIKQCHVDVNAIKRGDWTPVMIAALKGRTDIVQLLVESGALLEVVSKDGRTALHMAAQEGHVDTCRYLANRCPIAMIKATNSGRLPTQMAAALAEQPQAALDIVTLLLSSSPIPEHDLLFHRDNSGHNILQDAVVARNLTLLRLLFERGANPNDTDSIGRNMIHYAAMIGHLDVLQLLLSLSSEGSKNPPDWGTPDWDTPDTWDHWSPLMHAAKEGHLDVVRFLVETIHADNHRTDKKGRTAKDLAALWNHQEVIDYLDSL